MPGTLQLIFLHRHGNEGRCGMAMVTGSIVTGQIRGNLKSPSGTSPEGVRLRAKGDLFTHGPCAII